MSGEYEVQGIPVSELAERFGTPFYLYDGDALREQFRGLRTRLHPRLEMFFSLKSNPNVSVCALLGGLGARAEVSSLAELVTALRAGVTPENIIFLGPGKSRAELLACLDEKVHAIVCESAGELELIDRLAGERGVVADVALRVNPSFSVKGSGLTMGGKPRQFGIDEEQLLAEPGLAARFPNVRLMGVHAYMGTRILSEEVVVENTVRILDLAERLSTKMDFPLELVDVGGGLGVAYFQDERDLDPALLTGRLNPVIEEFAARHPHTRMIMELGRYLTAPAGTYVVRVRYVKTSMGENFAVADGGTNHHMAAVGIGSFVKRNFPMRLLSRDEPATQEWYVTGPLCTPNDTIGKLVPLPPLRPGDLLGVLRSGAYGPSASPVLFLSHGSPAEVLVVDGTARLVRERDDIDDLLRPQHLAL
ncbi:type III PLP-dependent enzyme [Microbispora sp. RL4-1S]|uniref:Type III PLP-dependent enzyme n=1 Tax=Microbispora oryzae TaxID=2806554 RepID=A0A940WKF5_9ACTN|nr:type III PLP-dependent enzyme [Microbispora oryzae]MBP2702771.1 type III PLP-dependent enzyme [Microbispora oryzae]